ncbi:MAG TPA: hypothetical protein VJ803_11770 [Gemmatimonadaceae bacterium]|nr:hypothetical protein [Gemmatimonadaceae bacterium]
MKSTLKRYETPVVAFSGDIVEKTRLGIVGSVEIDFEPREAAASVGFGI